MARSVQFDEQAHEGPLPDSYRKHSISSTSDRDHQDRNMRHDNRINAQDHHKSKLHESSGTRSSSHRDRSHHRPSGQKSSAYGSSSDRSDAALPPDRFDKHGRPLPAANTNHYHDNRDRASSNAGSLTNRIENVLNGRAAGDLFKRALK